MKSIVQTVGAILILFFVIGGVTFMTQYVKTEDQSKSSNGQNSNSNDDPSTKPEYKMSFPMNIWKEPNDVEKEQTGYHDFYVENPNADDGELVLDDKSCKCQTVLVFLAQESEKAKLKNDFLGSGKTKELDLDRLNRWIVLKTEKEKPGRPNVGEESVKIAGQGAGVIRVTWKANNLGPLGLGAAFWTQAKGDATTRGAAPVGLRIEVNVVPAVKVYPESLTLPELTPDNRQESKEFVCYSTTRKDFKLQAHLEEVRDRDFFQITWDKMTPKECGEFAEKLAKEVESTGREEKPGKPNIQSAYRLQVTVQEQLANGKQMDIGEFRRHIVLVPGEAGETSYLVTGSVRGEIEILNEEQGKIILGNFSSKSGISKTVLLDTHQSKVKLKLESFHPAYLKVKLEEPEPGSTQWRLTVEIPPNRTTGSLALESGVVLKMDDKDRKVRIPVRGRGIQ